MKIKRAIEVLTIVAEMLENKTIEPDPRASEKRSAETHYDGASRNPGQAVDATPRPYLIQMLIAHTRAIIQGMTPK
jgi:hypothetical protein